MPDELLTVPEVATELKVTEPTVRRWINKGQLRARRLAGGKDYRVLRSDVEEMLGIDATPVPGPPRATFRPTTAQIEVL